MQVIASKKNIRDEWTITRNILFKRKDKTHWAQRGSKRGSCQSIRVKIKKDFGFISLSRSFAESINPKQKPLLNDANHSGFESEAVSNKQGQWNSRVVENPKINQHYSVKNKIRKLI